MNNCRFFNDLYRQPEIGDRRNNQAKRRGLQLERQQPPTLGLSITNNLVTYIRLAIEVGDRNRGRR